MSSSSQGRWPCPLCTYLNPHLFLACEVCGNERPHAGNQGAATASSALAHAPLYDQAVELHIWAAEAHAGLAEATAGPSSSQPACHQELQPQEAGSTRQGGGAAASPLETASAPSVQRQPQRQAQQQQASTCTACAYCTLSLPPYERWYCRDCCTGAGAPWFSCRSCAMQKSQLGGSSRVMTLADILGEPSDEPATKRPRREKDSPSPCFDSRHTFVPVVAPPGAVADTRLYLEPASAVGRQERAERFTRDYLPDGAPPHVAWLQVHGDRRHEMVDASWDMEERIAKAQGEWEAAKRQGNATSQVVLQLAKQNSILSGKWMVFPKPEEEVANWREIVKAVYCEGICCAAKIAGGPQAEGKWRRVICAYTANFDDRADVMAAHKGIANALTRALGRRASWQIRYKPDIYTYLGLYFKKSESNPLGIPTTIYTAKLEPDEEVVAAVEAGAGGGLGSGSGSGSSGTTPAGGDATEAGAGREWEGGVPAEAGPAAAGAADGVPQAQDPRAAAAAAAMARAAGKGRGSTAAGSKAAGAVRSAAAAGPAAGGFSPGSYQIGRAAQQAAPVALVAQPAFPRAATRAGEAAVRGRTGSLGDQGSPKPSRPQPGGSGQPHSPSAAAAVPTLPAGVAAAAMAPTGRASEPMSEGFLQPDLEPSEQEESPPAVANSGIEQPDPLAEVWPWPWPRPGECAPTQPLTAAPAAPAAAGVAGGASSAGGIDAAPGRAGQQRVPAAAALLAGSGGNNIEAAAVSAEPKPLSAEAAAPAGVSSRAAADAVAGQQAPALPGAATSTLGVSGGIGRKLSLRERMALLKSQT